MISCIGSWNFGVEVAHYVLVLLSCLCNVNKILEDVAAQLLDIHTFTLQTGFKLESKKCTSCLFGKSTSIFHLLKVLMTSFQSALKNFLTRANTLQNEFITVELQLAMCYSWLKMNLTMPPMSVSHNSEIKIFNDFMKEHHSLNRFNLTKLQRLFN